MKKKLFGTLCFWTFMSGSLIAQEFKADLKRINQAYKNAPTLAMNVDYIVFESWENDVQIQHEKGKIKKSGASVYSKIGPLESVQNEWYSLVVDHDDKTIAIFRKYGDENEVDPNQVFNGLDRVLDDCTPVSFKKTGKKQGVYSFGFPEQMSQYGKAEITFSLENYFFERMVLYYAEEQDLDDDKKNESAPRLEISYSDISTHPSAENWFDYSKYLVLKNKQFSCRSMYSDYQIIDKYNRD